MQETGQYIYIYIDDVLKGCFPNEYKTFYSSFHIVAGNAKWEYLNNFPNKISGLKCDC